MIQNNNVSLKKLANKLIVEDRSLANVFCINIACLFIFTDFLPYMGWSMVGGGVPVVVGQRREGYDLPFCFLIDILIFLMGHSPHKP